MLRIAFFAALVALSSAALKFSDCGNKEVIDVKVTNCDGATCTLHKGKEVTITVDFTANEDSSAAKIEIIANYQGIEIPVPGIDTDACKYMTCPLKKGAASTLRYTLTIPAIAPTIEADVTAKLIGDGGKVLGCGTVHGDIED